MSLRPERRLAPRRNTYIEATIVFGGGRASRPCIIRNVSDTGARVEVDSVIGIPDTFDLLTPGHVPQSCRVVWRTLRELGLHYTA